MSEARERLTVVAVGHMDHGKSTVVGRLLADAGSLPKGKLDQVKDVCARGSGPFEYAYLIDALKDERSQGITIEAARVFFRAARRDYLIIDVPGHVELLKNMVSGAAQASAALLVIDAAEGVRENSKRHGYLLAMLGVRQVAVLVNKMDLVAYDESAFRAIVEEYGAFLGRAEVSASAFIPTAALLGGNLASRSEAMPWYAGPTVLEALDGFRAETAPAEKAFRLPVQGVYQSAPRGDGRRIIAGTVESGELAAGDEVVFWPSGKSGTVKTLERFPAGGVVPFTAGEAAGFTLTEQIYVRRGEIAARRSQPRPLLARRLRAGVFWLGREPLRPGREYALKLATARVRARLERVVRAVDASSLEPLPGREEVRRNEVAECLFVLDAALACERAQDHAALGRFVLVDGWEIGGGGLIREVLADPTEAGREMVVRRNIKWRAGAVGLSQREERLAQRSTVVLVTGSDDGLRRAVAKELERRLFDAGRFVYFLGIGSVLYGVDADIRDGSGDHAEDIRRLAEVAHILVDAGLILIVTASRLAAEDIERLRTGVDASKLLAVWAGEGPADGPACDLELGAASVGDCVERVIELMRRRGVMELP